MSAASINKQGLKLYLENFFKKKEDFVIEKFRIGQSNPTFFVKYGSTKLVVRKKPPGKLLKGAHQINREYKVISALKKAGFDVPKPIVYCSDESVLGTEFYLMEFCEGKVFFDDFDGIRTSDLPQVIYSAIDTLAKLHSYKPEEIGLSDYGRPYGYCKRQVATWSRQYKASMTRNNPAMNDLIAWLEQNIPDEVPGQSRVVHGDYSLSNIMFDIRSTPKVRAVLDWELSTIGHPLADLAYFCMTLYHLPEGFQNLNLVSLKSVIPTEIDVVKRYCAVAGIMYPPKDYDFCMAMAFFKLAAISQGIYARFLQGNNSSSGSLAKFENYTTRLAEGGMKYIEKQRQANPSMSIRKMSSAPMTLSPSQKGQETLERLKKFLKEEIDPNMWKYKQQFESAESRWCVVPVLEEWKAKAKSQGLWNLFLPGVSGLSNVDYAHIAEQLGKHHLYSEIVNCSAPDTGNMEVIYKYGSDYQKKTWLQPLLDGKIRSAFCMTEPDVASSDATNMQLSIKRDGDEYIVNGIKWWSSGGGDPRCKIAIVMGRVEGGRGSGGRHGVHSMILVPLDLPGVKIKRQLSVFGFDDAPHGHSEIEFNNVRVPLRNIILGEGRGFEIAQGRLGPGRIHHCMRSIGVAENCMELFVKRGAERVAFGKNLLDHEVVQHQLAECRNKIDQARLLTLYAAHMIDTKGSKSARKEIAMIKVVALRMLTQVIDRTIQVHGGGGVSQDFPLSKWYAGARSLQIADGPDEVHLSSIAKMEIREQMQKAKL